MSKKGFLISIEGLPKAGKTTQAKLLFKKLNKLSYPTILIGELKKNTDFISEAIKKLASPPLFQIDNPYIESLLHAARGIYLNEKFIIPMFNKGKVIISDRGIDTFLVFQITHFKKVLGDKFNFKEHLKWLRLLLLRNILKPNLTFYIEVSVETIIKRFTNGEETLSIVDKEFLKNISYYYSLFLDKSDVRIVKINGENSTEEISEQILVITQKLLR